MKLHINDANILIDIVQLDLVEAFLALQFELYTTDFVFEELEDNQKPKFISDKLIILKTDEHELLNISQLTSQHSGLSFEDCSVWYYAQKMDGILITGDSKLRAKAIRAGIEVRGIIYIIEEIKNQNILEKSVCIEKLEAVKILNNRLPIIEIDKRIQLWTIEL